MKKNFVFNLVLVILMFILPYFTFAEEDKTINEEVKIEGVISEEIIDQRIKASLIGSNGKYDTFFEGETNIDLVILKSDSIYRMQNRSDSGDEYKFSTKLELSEEEYNPYAEYNYRRDNESDIKYHRTTFGISDRFFNVVKLYIAAGYEFKEIVGEDIDGFIIEVGEKFKKDVFTFASLIIDGKAIFVEDSGQLDELFKIELEIGLDDNLDFLIRYEYENTNNISDNRTFAIISYTVM